MSVWFFCSTSPPALAADGRSQLFIEGGAYLPEPAYVAQDNQGSKSLLSPAYFIFGPRPVVPLTATLKFEPSVRFVLPWRKNIDGSQRYFTSLYNLDAGWFILPQWEVRGGVGFQWTFVTGSAATVTQKNGTSTATFYTPAVSQSVWQGAFDLGTSYYLGGSLRATFDLAMWEPMSSARRRLSLVLGVDYAFF